MDNIRASEKLFIEILKKDLSFHEKYPYSSRNNPSIQNWHQIPESGSVKWGYNLISKILVDDDVKFIYDPFAGSCTTGLAAMRLGIPYIGCELREELVISGLAKLGHKRVSLEKVDSLIHQLDEVLVDTKESYKKKVNKVVDVISGSNLTSVDKNFLMIGIFRLIDNLDGDTGSKRSIKKELINEISSLKTDIQKSNFFDIPFVFGRIDSTSFNISKVINSLVGGKNNPGLLITSPTFISSSMIVNENSKFKNTISQKIIKDTKYDKTVSLIEEKITFNHFPNMAIDFVKLIATVLYNFTFIQGSKIVIIENENAIVNGEVIEADKYIVDAAIQLGYAVREIILTHYIIEPGTISYSETDKRGTVIILSHE